MSKTDTQIARARQLTEALRDRLSPGYMLDELDTSGLIVLTDNVYNAIASFKVDHYHTDEPWFVTVTLHAEGTLVDADGMPKLGTAKLRNGEPPSFRNFSLDDLENLTAFVVRQGGWRLDKSTVAPFTKGATGAENDDEFNSPDDGIPPCSVEDGNAWRVPFEALIAELRAHTGGNFQLIPIPSGWGVCLNNDVCLSFTRRGFNGRHFLCAAVLGRPIAIDAGYFLPNLLDPQLLLAPADPTASLNTLVGWLEWMSTLDSEIPNPFRVRPTPRGFAPPSMT